MSEEERTIDVEDLRTLWPGCKLKPQWSHVMGGAYAAQPTGRDVINIPDGKYFFNLLTNWEEIASCQRSSKETILVNSFYSYYEKARKDLESIGIEAELIVRAEISYADYT